MRLNLFLFFGLFFFLSVDVHAQGFRYGVMAGINQSNAIFTNNLNVSNDDFSSFTGYNFNAIIEYRGAKKIGFSIEPGYIQKGYEREKADVQWEVDYFQLPVLFNYYVTDKLVALVGPEFALHINKKTLNLYEQFSLSSVLGARYSLNDHFDLGLRWGRGLSPYLRYNLTDVDGKSLGEGKEFHQYFQLNVAYKI